MCLQACVKRDLRHFLGLPLALVGLVVTAALVAKAAWSIYQSATYDPFNDGANVSRLVFACLQALLALIPLLGILFRKAKLVSMGATLLMPLIIMVGAELVSSWWTWGRRIKGQGYVEDQHGNMEWDSNAHIPLTDREKAEMIVMTIILVFFIIGLILLMSVFASLGQILAAGGSGWKRETAADIRKRKAAEKKAAQTPPDLV